MRQTIRQPRTSEVCGICTAITSVLLVAAAGVCSALTFAADDGTSSLPPFWPGLSGAWLGELTYLDGNMQPILQSYQSVVTLELRGQELSQTEYKFYPPGASLTRSMGGASLPVGQGIEVVTAMGGPVDEGRWQPAGNGIYELVGGATLVRHMFNPETGIPQYVIYWTLTSPRTLLISTNGIVSTVDPAAQDGQRPDAQTPKPGELRGHSVFRFTRIPSEDVEGQRELLRLRHNVARTVDRRGGD